MFTRLTFRKTNFAASRLGSWISEAFNRKTKIKNPIAILIALLTATLLITAFAVSARSWLAKPAPKTAPVPQSPGNKSNIEVEAVTLLQWGFEPKEITRPEGRFQLAINNQSQMHEQLTFSLAVDKGYKLNEVRLRGGSKHHWDGLYDLKPGKYQLTVGGHPEWVCTLNITDK
jgi:hypothetical protein